MHSGSEPAQPAVTVDDLHLTYRTSFDNRPTLRTLIHRGAPQRREVRALRGVTLTVPHGAVLGVIGRNGAGKSTLLRAVAGILPPTQGRVVVDGRVTTMLSLGVAFKRSLSGRDNILLGGLALGLTRAEIAARIDEIVDFAELGEFIDYPVRTYSSGMKGRLGFALATSFDPDVLLIDEALSTGDAAFRRKCLTRMEHLGASAATIVLVSHSVNTIRSIATDCVWLHNGRVEAMGEPDDVVEQYERFSGIDVEGPEILEDL